MGAQVPDGDRLEFPPVERRQHRFEVRPCLHCGRDTVTVASRTDYALYLRCSACARVWSAPKPDRLKLGA